MISEGGSRELHVLFRTSQVRTRRWVWMKKWWKFKTLIKKDPSIHFDIGAPFCNGLCTKLLVHFNKLHLKCVNFRVFAGMRFIKLVISMLSPLSLRIMSARHTLRLINITLRKLCWRNSNNFTVLTSYRKRPETTRPQRNHHQAVFK